MSSLRKWAAGLLLSAGLAGCSPDPHEQAQRSVDSGQAAREVQARFDSMGRQCAPVLTGWSPIELSRQAAQRDSVRALVSAGLLEAAPVVKAGEVRLRPTAGAKADFKETAGEGGRPPTLELCYARRQVARTWTSGEPASLNFAYRLVDAAPWTGDARIRSAFPFLGPALSQELVYEGLTPYRDGHWMLDLVDRQILVPGHVEGFFVCPSGVESSQGGCAK